MLTQCSQRLDLVRTQLTGVAVAPAFISLVFLWEDPGPDGLNSTLGTPPCPHLAVYLTQDLRATVCPVMFTSNPTGL